MQPLSDMQCSEVSTMNIVNWCNHKSELHVDEILDQNIDVRNSYVLILMVYWDIEKS